MSDLFTSNRPVSHTPVNDPWSSMTHTPAPTPTSQLVTLPPAPSSKPTNRIINGNHSPNTNPNKATNPWSNNGNTDPWASSPAASNNNNNNKIDDFDLFTTNRVTTTTTSTNKTTNNTLSSNNDPFGDFFGENKTKTSTNPWDSSIDKQKSTIIDPFETISSLPQNTNKNIQNPVRKTPESFLGENSSLVNLDNLIPARSKSTNPFGSAIQPTTTNLPTSNSIGNLNNPFMSQQKPVPTISQLQSQQNPFPFAGSTTLPQPLINAPAQPFSMAFPTAQPFIQPNILPAFVAPTQNLFTNSTSSTNSSSTHPTTNPFLMM